VGFIGDRGDGFVGAYFSRMRIAPTYLSTSRLESSSFGLSLENVPFIITGGGQTVRLDSTDGLRITSTAIGDSRESYFSSGQMRQRASQFSSDTTRITHGDVALGAFDGLNYPMRILGGAFDSYLLAQGGGGTTFAGYLSGTHVLSTTGEIRCGSTPKIVARQGRIVFALSDIVNGAFTRDSWSKSIYIYDETGFYVGQIPVF
jgi:hypothetical protein